MSRAPKKPRTSRRPSRAVLELTDRDADVLTLTAIAKIITTDQLARDCFTSLDRARRRLRVLFDVGYVQVTMLDSKRPSLFSITRKGLDALLTIRPALAKRVGLPGPIRLAGLTRHLLLTDARLYAAALGEARQAPLVRWCPGAAAELRQLGLEELRLEPDAVAEFATDGTNTWISIEVDLGTTGETSVRAKFAKYVELARLGTVDALWWVNAGGAERGQIVRQLAARVGLAEWCRVVPLRQLLVRPAVLPPREEDEERTVGPVSPDAYRADRVDAYGVASDRSAVDRRADRRGDG